MASEATCDLAFAYLSVPPGGEKENARVLGYSWRSMMARMAAAPAPSECPTHTTSKSRVSCVQKFGFLAANSNGGFRRLSDLGQVERPTQQVLLLQAAVHVGCGIDDAL